MSGGADDGRDCTRDFGREWKIGADGVCKREGISRGGALIDCGELGVGAGWLDVDVDGSKGVWCRGGDVEGGVGEGF